MKDKKFNLNGHPMGFLPQTRQLVLRSTQIVPLDRCESTAEAEAEAFEWSRPESFRRPQARKLDHVLTKQMAWHVRTTLMYS